MWWFVGQAGLNAAPIGARDGSRFDAELDEHHWLGHRMVGETMRYVAPNQRFCILPSGCRQNAASAVMSRTLKRLSTDWVEGWGHPVLSVETFVNPSHHIGTCCGASGLPWVRWRQAIERS